MKAAGLIEEFLHHLAVERGLARNTLLAYGQDLSKFARFLELKPLRSFFPASFLTRFTCLRGKMPERVSGNPVPHLAGAGLAREG